MFIEHGQLTVFSASESMFIENERLTVFSAVVRHTVQRVAVPTVSGKRMCGSPRKVRKAKQSGTGLCTLHTLE